MPLRHGRSGERQDIGMEEESLEYFFGPPARRKIQRSDQHQSVRLGCHKTLSPPTNTIRDEPDQLTLILTQDVLYDLESLLPKKVRYGVKEITTIIKLKFCVSVSFVASLAFQVHFSELPSPRAH